MTDPDRRTLVARVLALLTVVAISIAMVVGTVADGGLSSPWLWIGLVLVPVLLWLIRQAGWHR